MEICLPRVKGVLGTVSDFSPVQTRFHATCVVLLSAIQPAFCGWVETLVFFGCTTNCYTLIFMGQKLKFTHTCTQTKRRRHRRRLGHAHAHTHTLIQLCLLISHLLFSVSIKPMTTTLVFLRCVCMCVCVGGVFVYVCVCVCVCIQPKQGRRTIQPAKETPLDSNVTASR